MSSRATTSSLLTRIFAPHPDLAVILAVALFGLILSALMLPLFDPQATDAIVLPGP
jgi:hypothetical protein